MNNTVKHLDSLCVIHVDFDIWSGQTRLSPADFKLGVGGEIPSDKVAQLGSKKICDPAKLKGFGRLKTETRRLLLRYGMPFMNGFAVPASRAEFICKALNKIQQEFEQLKRIFINGYHDAVEEWVIENPEYEAAIRAGTLPRSTVEKRIGFEYQVFMIQPTGDDATGKSLTKKVEGLAGDLLDEVVDEAGKFFSKNLSGRQECGTGTRATLRNLRDKIDGLSFLNSSFVPLVGLLDQTLRGYQQHAEGRIIRAPFFYQVVAATLIMSDRKRIEEYVNGVVTVESMAQSVIRDTEIGEGGDGGGHSEILTSPQLERDLIPHRQPLATLQGTAQEESSGSNYADVGDDLDADLDAFFGKFADNAEQAEKQKANENSQKESNVDQKSDANSPHLPDDGVEDFFI